MLLYCKEYFRFLWWDIIFTYYPVIHNFCFMGIIACFNLSNQRDIFTHQPVHFRNCATNNLDTGPDFALGPRLCCCCLMLTSMVTLKFFIILFMVVCCTLHKMFHDLKTKDKNIPFKAGPYVITLNKKHRYVNCSAVLLIQMQLKPAMKREHYWNKAIAGSLAKHWAGLLYCWNYRIPMWWILANLAVTV